MRHTGRSSSALAVAASGVALALVVAACGGSASPSPAAPAASQDAGASSQAAGGGTTAGCADPAKLASAMQSADHYIATADLSAAIPTASAAGGLSIQMKMEVAKPDKMRVSAGMAGSSGALFEMVTVGQDSWIRMFGGDTWAKSDAAASPAPSANPDVLGSLFDSSGLQPLDTLPDGLTLPGSSSCVVAYTISAPPAISGGDSNPLAELGGASAFVARVDTSTGRPQSMGFLIDPAKVTASGPTAIVFSFDYDTAVDISAPDPSKVVEGGFPLPSGLVLPSGLTLP